MPRPYIWGHLVDLGKDFRNRGLGQIQKEETSTKTERVERTQEEGLILEDITKDKTIDIETFQKT